VIDTAKVANLYLCHPENDLLDFVNEPIGKGMPVNRVLMPLIASENTLIGLVHDQAKSIIIIMQGSYRSWKSWKVLEFYSGIFQDWKVLEN